MNLKDIGGFDLHSTVLKIDSLSEDAFALLSCMHCVNFGKSHERIRFKQHTNTFSVKTINEVQEALASIEKYELAKYLDSMIEDKTLIAFKDLLNIQ